jgi:hypothetical protein
MRKLERVHLISDARGSSNGKPSESALPAIAHSEPAMVAVPQLPETGFLLDWLSGGEVYPRSIQGFSLRFEPLM